jgi:hypothetical protein
MAMGVTPAENASNWASAIESGATVVALVVGGVWTYLKFFKNRVYRPRLDVSTHAGTVPTSPRQLVCSVSVKNIGTSKVRLIQEGTGLRLHVGEPPDESYLLTKWTSQAVLPLFQEHEWFESGETIHHELSVAVPDDAKLFRLDVRLVCQRRTRSNLVMYSRSVVPASVTWMPRAKEEPDVK